MDVRNIYCNDYIVATLSKSNQTGKESSSKVLNQLDSSNMTKYTMRAIRYVRTDRH